jgi:hypothetical protein
MGNEMPDPSGYSGLSRKVLQYCAAFDRIAQKLKRGDLSEADWAPIEELVDTRNFVRLGVFSEPQSELIDWPTYRKYLTQYGGATSWEGTLRRITETPGLVHLELEERNTRDGVMNVSNTVTIYKFDQAGRLTNLDVYISHIENRAVQVA